MTLVVRPDLSKRTALSKSELVGAYWCPTKAAYQRITKEPIRVTPDMAFGSAVDAGVEQIAAQMRAHGRVIDPNTPRLAAAEAVLRDEQPVDLDEVVTALEAFERDVVPEFDWAFCATQHTIHVDLPGLGETEGHPDLIFADGTVADVKTGKAAKNPDSIYFGPEIGLYAAMREVETGERPKRAGYLTWLRLKKPKWQVLLLPVDDDMVAEALEHARRQVHRRRLIDLVGSKGLDPSDYFDGARFPSLCLDCNFNDRCATGQRRVRRLAGEEERDGLAAA